MVAKMGSTPYRNGEAGEDTALPPKDKTQLSDAEILALKELVADYEAGRRVFKVLAFLGSLAGGIAMLVYYILGIKKIV